MQQGNAARNAARCRTQKRAPFCCTATIGTRLQVWQGSGRVDPPGCAAGTYLDPIFHYAQATSLLVPSPGYCRSRPPSLTSHVSASPPALSAAFTNSARAPPRRRPRAPRQCHPRGVLAKYYQVQTQSRRFAQPRDVLLAHRTALAGWTRERPRRRCDREPETRRKRSTSSTLKGRGDGMPDIGKGSPMHADRPMRRHARPKTDDCQTASASPIPGVCSDSAVYG